jgi:uncharacterized glyoxalase superfamily protein PhnB
MSAKLYIVLLPVTNIEEAETFYAQLLENPGIRVSPGRHYFNLDGTILACYDPQADGDATVATSNPEHIYLSISDLDGAYRRIQTLGTTWLEEQIEVRPWGERSFYAKDPFGNPIAFVDASTAFVAA